jgi:hypothetical protein
MGLYVVLIGSRNSAKINLNKRIYLQYSFSIIPEPSIKLKLSNTTLYVIYVLIVVIIILTMVVAFIPGLR